MERNIRVSFKNTISYGIWIARPFFLLRSTRIFTPVSCCPEWFSINLNQIWFKLYLFLQKILVGLLPEPSLPLESLERWLKWMKNWEPEVWSRIRLSKTSVSATPGGDQSLPLLQRRPQSLLGRSLLMKSKYLKMAKFEMISEKKYIREKVNCIFFY